MAVVMLFLYLFQIVLMGSFYETMKLQNVKAAAETMISKYDRNNPWGCNKDFNLLAHENEFCYTLYSSYGEAIIYDNFVMGNSCLIHSKVSADTIRRCYIQLKNDGDFTWMEFNRDINAETCLMGYLLPDDNMLIINTSLNPVSATTTIIKQQMVYVLMVLSIVSLVMSFFMSKSIAKPIVTLKKTADKLAQGEYGTVFDGGKFEEMQSLANTLTFASNEISRVDSMQRDLIANVSHDLRTPLTMVKAYAEMIRDLSGDNPKKREEHLGIIIDETDRLALLVNDMLDLSKLESSGQQLEFTDCNITAKLREIIDRYKGYSKLMGYTINFEPDEEVIVRCDVVKIEQVIYNLINNAINYTGDDKQVFVKQTNEIGFVKIEVRDTGHGISEENLHLIFNKYYRAEKTRREVVGTGLGLSIVRAVLKKHRYPFGVRSKLESGTVFWFKIKL